MNAVQSLLLRKPPGAACAHLLLHAPAGKGAALAQWLPQLQPVSFGANPPPGPRLSIGLSFSGLQAMRLPPGYQRVFHRLAPAFVDGAAQRAGRTGDRGPSAPSSWDSRFHPTPPHLLLSWHGDAPAVHAAVQQAQQSWQQRFGQAAPAALEGRTRPGPGKAPGDWLPFGLRDGISEVCIDDPALQPALLDPRPHRPGALLLGHANDDESNPFALPSANAAVRAFFHDSSFGVLRQIEQDVPAFEAQLQTWLQQLHLIDPGITRDFLLAKLTGRWPDGRALMPGARSPQGAGYRLAPSLDADGLGCPFASHVRRLHGDPDGAPLRPLQRRSLPYVNGWQEGLLGHFFCADLSAQYEHLLGQWAQRPPLGQAARTGSAADPLAGLHDDPDADWRLPLNPGQPALALRGLRPWLTTRGSVYAWYPGEAGLHTLLSGDFKPFDPEGAWR